MVIYTMCQAQLESKYKDYTNVLVFHWYNIYTYALHAVWYIKYFACHWMFVWDKTVCFKFDALQLYNETVHRRFIRILVTHRNPFRQRVQRL